MSDAMDPDAIDAAVDAVAAGDLIVYPTETVYGLGADALSVAAIQRVYDLKNRSRDDPLSLGVPDVASALSYTRPTDREEQFMRTFLPGPVTVVVERRETVPDVLTAGRERVGVRVPDHDLARTLLDRTGPLTATSANVSGSGSVTDPAALDEQIREGVAVVLDAGETPGTESTVVDPGTGEIHRAGAVADEVREWLASHPA